MLIPSIDLRNGKVVQLVQGRHLAVEHDDVFVWVRRFARFPIVQVIDLDAAMGTGENGDLVRDICAALPARVGGGIRTLERLRAVLGYGARQAILGSPLFRDGRPDLDFARRAADAVGAERIVAAVDSLGGRVVIKGWREPTTVTAIEAVRVFESHCGGFLYTHVDTEGLLQGIDLEAVRQVREATVRPLAAAGGITTRAEIEALAAMGVDAVVGMAIYTGALDPDAFAPGDGQA